MRRLAATALLLLGTTTFAQEPADRFVDLGAHRLHLKVHTPLNVAAARPVIVLESGGGFDASQWSNLQPELANQLSVRVVAYDRPGFGQSGLPETPYDIREEVTGLHTALTELGLADRVVFVAHSYGALLAQLYASMWPETVSGLVFLDPNSAGTMIALHDIQTRPFKTTPPETQRERAFARIDAAIWETLVTVYRSPIPQQIPLLVVSAEKGFFPEQRQVDAFRLTHQLLALSVKDGRVVVAEGSNHMIPAQRPDIVVDSVRSMLDKVQ